MPERPNDVVTIEELNGWLDGLTPHDLRNYQTLISLKKAPEIVNQMPDGKYKRMVIAGVAYRLAMKQMSPLIDKIAQGGPGNA